MEESAIALALYAIAFALGLGLAIVGLAIAFVGWLESRRAQPECITETYPPPDSDEPPAVIPMTKH